MLIEWQLLTWVRPGEAFAQGGLILIQPTAFGTFLLIS